MTVTEYNFEVTLRAVDENDGTITMYSGHEWAENAIVAINLRCSRHGINPKKVVYADADNHGGRSERTVERA